LFNDLLAALLGACVAEESEGDAATPRAEPVTSTPPAPVAPTTPAGDVASIPRRVESADPARLRLLVTTSKNLAALRSSSDSEEPIVVTVAGDLLAVLVEDRPRALRLLDEKILMASAATRDGATALALEHHRENLPSIASVTRALPWRTFGTIAGDQFTATRLLIHGDWDQLQQRLRGRLIVAVPESGTIVYGAENFRDGVDGLVFVAESIAGSAARPLSTTVLRWTGRGWEVVRPGYR
jgi:hypothetical protein